MCENWPTPTLDVAERAGVVAISTAAIQVEELDLVAGDFSLHVEALRLPQGSRTAIVGPNGSGKTTLVESLLGLRSARRLRASILGKPIAEWQSRPSRRRRIGVQLQQGMYPSQLTPEELVALHKAMFGRTDPKVADALGIRLLGRVAYRDLSGGQRQRLNLYMALAHEPELAILDEPFTGLDRNYAHALADILDRRQQTLLFVCHTSDELALADWLVWMQEGRVRLSNSISLALDLLCGHVQFTFCLPDAEAAVTAANAIANLPHVAQIDWSGPRQFSVSGSPGLRDAVQNIAHTWDLEEFSFRPRNLNDLLRLCTERRHA